MTTPSDQEKAQAKVVRYLQSAHAMEQQSLDLIQSLARQTEDDQFEQALALHANETRDHLVFLERRLEALGDDTSTFKETQNKVMAAASAAAAAMRPDQAGKNARDAYVAAQVEIAFYEMLERLARRAGDEETGDLVRLIRHNEEAHAHKIASMWDHFVDLSLRETT
ncbi:MAG: ferritin-like domain-containing protein [Chloroflexota bacterium]|nr:ferritin-like domain-containing protein [Chloroflexota bacterium]